MTISTSHVDYDCKRASTAIAALLMIMSNSSAEIASKCKLLAGVALFILRYGGPIWSKALTTSRNLKRLRVASAYRTVSKEAVGIIAGMTPIGLIIKEDVQCFNQRVTKGVCNVCRKTMQGWKQSEGKIIVTLVTKKVT